MRKAYRVKSKKDFQTIFNEGSNIANRKFVIYRLDKEQDHYRVGISVSKRLGNAVVRNRIKRKIRHVLMTYQRQLEPTDFVVIARKGVEELSYQEIDQNLKHALKIAKLYRKGMDCEEKD